MTAIARRSLLQRARSRASYVEYFSSARHICCGQPFNATSYLVWCMDHLPGALRWLRTLRLSSRCWGVSLNAFAAWAIFPTTSGWMNLALSAYRTSVFTQTWSLCIAPYMAWSIVRRLISASCKRGQTRGVEALDWCSAGRTLVSPLPCSAYAPLRNGIDYRCASRTARPLPLLSATQNCFYHDRNVCYCWNSVVLLIAFNLFHFIFISMLCIFIILCLAGGNHRSIWAFIFPFLNE